jgi:oligopeptide transport system ATP-binding protein
MIAPAKTALLTVRDLQCWFSTPTGILRAVDRISLQVGEGQRIGIVGESGSGKTQTFLGVLGLTLGFPGVVAGSATLGTTELLSGLGSFVRPDEKRKEDAAWRREAERWKNRHRQLLEPVLGKEVAVLFQDARRSLVPHWTIGRHLEQIIGRRSPRDARAEAKEIVRQLGFRDPGRILDAFPGELSGGEAQRAMVALAIAIRPRLVIADEPTTGLDAINQSVVLDQLGNACAESGAALVLISHDLAVVEGLVDQVYVFFAGRVMERAPVGVLRRAATGRVHPYTQELRESQSRRTAGLPIVGVIPFDRGPRSGRGCPYARRCGLRPRLDAATQTRCTTETPPDVQLSPDHSVTCWGFAP